MSPINDKDFKKTYYVNVRCNSVQHAACCPLSNEAKIVIRKAERCLIFSAAGRAELTYRVVLGRNSAADKAVEGDHATPIGVFFVCAKNPRSKYFRSLCISYPNAEDARRGLAAGLINAAEHTEIIDALRLGRMPPQHTRLGGEIYIHGGKDADGAPDAKDWTRGCIALADSEMRQLYDLIPLGTPVVIVE